MLLTVLILSFNEEVHIERCIKSVSSIAKKIFVVDSFSNDNTVEIAESLGATVFQNKWPGNHAIQYQWGLDNCPIETEWVMRLDSDEYLLPQLRDEILFSLPKLDDAVSGVYMKRRVHFMGKWIKFGGYYPTYLLRMWRHRRGIMEQRWMDEHVKILSGKTVRFENDFVDDNKNSLTWWTEKHNNYSIREAADILNTLYKFKVYDSVEPVFFGTQEQRKRWLKIRYASLPLFLRPIIYFLWRYFFKFGFMDGKQGAIWHVLQGGWYRFLVDSKIFEIYLSCGKDKAKIKSYLMEKYGVDF